MGLWHLERKPQFLERARTEFERECQFYLDDDGNESLQVFMNRVFTDWILFESNVFETSQSNITSVTAIASVMRIEAFSSRWTRIRSSSSSVSTGY